MELQHILNEWPRLSAPPLDGPGIIQWRDLTLACGQCHAITRAYTDDEMRHAMASQDGEVTLLCGLCGWETRYLLPAEYYNDGLGYA